MELKVYFDDIENTLEIKKNDEIKIIILNDQEMVDLIEMGISYEYQGMKY